MARFNAEYTAPANTATEVTAAARAAFQNAEAEQLFAGLGLREGGFQSNASRVFITDAAGNLVAPPPYDANDDHGIAAAARDGRMFIMGKDYRLRQVRLEGNEKDGFAFVASSLLQREQWPSVSVGYYFRRLSVAAEDLAESTAQNWANMKRDMSEIYSQWKKDMAEWKQDMAKMWSDMKEDWANIKKGEFSFLDMLRRDWGGAFGRRDKEAEQAEVKVEEAPLIPEDEPVQTQQTVSAPTEEVQQTQPEQNKEKTLEDLLATNPTQQTTPEFDKYLKALGDRATGLLVDAALGKENGGPKDYYEALAQELEGQVARNIRKAAPSETTPEEREKFLDQKKLVMASMSKNLREFVQGKVEPEVVERFYAQGVNANPAMRAELQQNAARIQETGVNEYLAGVHAQNETARQMMQQSQPQPSQVVQQQMQLQQPQPQPQQQPQPGR